MALSVSRRSAFEWVQQAGMWLLNLVWPPKCGGCGTYAGTLWCATCDADTHLFDAAHASSEVLTEAGHAIQIWSVVRHERAIRKALHAFKYENTPHLSGPLAARMQALFPKVLALAGAKPVLVPVPLHPSRLRERGYNQSERLARALGASQRVSIRTDLLKRSRATEQQTKLDREARKQNVHAAFAADPAAKGLHILLIDDVLTTGATLAECADALYAAGAAQVHGLTLARAES